MPITLSLTITAETPDELNNQLSVICSTVGGQAVSGPTGGAAVVAVEKPKRSRGKKEEPVAAAEAAPEAKGFPVFQADGTKFSDFADPAKALARISDLINTCASLDELNNITTYNVETVERLSAELQDQYHNAVDDAYGLLENAAEGEAAGGELPTFEEVEEQIKAFVRKPGGGLIKMKSILSEFKANKVADVKPEHYLKLLEKVRVAA